MNSKYHLGNQGVLIRKVLLAKIGSNILIRKIETT